MYDGPTESRVEKEIYDFFFFIWMHDLFIHMNRENHGPVQSKRQRLWTSWAFAFKKPQ